MRPDLEETKPHILDVWAAVGPRLFWGRDDGPWIPWDLDAQDLNEECAVRKRPWPWCWGDQIWIHATWYEQKCMIRLLDVISTLLIERPGMTLEKRIAAEVSRVTRGHFRRLPPHWDFLAGPT